MASVQPGRCRLWEQLVVHMRCTSYWVPSATRLLYEVLKGCCSVREQLQRHLVALIRRRRIGKRPSIALSTQPLTPRLSNANKNKLTCILNTLYSATWHLFCVLRLPQSNCRISLQQPSSTSRSNPFTKPTYSARVYQTRGSWCAGEVNNQQWVRKPVAGRRNYRQTSHLAAGRL